MCENLLTIFVAQNKTLHRDRRPLARSPFFSWDFLVFLFLSLSSCRRVFGVTELWRSHVSGCAYICSVYMELIDVSESLLFQFVVESSAASCEDVPHLLKQLSFVCFSVFSPKPRVKGRGSPVETSAKQKRRPSRQARPSPSVPCKKIKRLQTAL